MESKQFTVTMRQTCPRLVESFKLFQSFLPMHDFGGYRGMANIWWANARRFQSGLELDCAERAAFESDGLPLLGARYLLANGGAWQGLPEHVICLQRPFGRAFDETSRLLMRWFFYKTETPCWAPKRTCGFGSMQSQIAFLGGFRGMLRDTLSWAIYGSPPLPTDFLPWNGDRKRSKELQRPAAVRVNLNIYHWKLQRKSACNHVGMLHLSTSVSITYTTSERLSMALISIIASLYVIYTCFFCVANAIQVGLICMFAEIQGWWVIAELVQNCLCFVTVNVASHWTICCLDCSNMSPVSDSVTTSFTAASRPAIYKLIIHLSITSEARCPQADIVSWGEASHALEHLQRLTKSKVTCIITNRRIPVNQTQHTCLQISW